MASSMWRMNGLCRRMAGVLVLCALLLSSEVMCQDDATDAPAADATAAAGDSAAAPDASAAPDAAAPTDTAGGDSSAASAAPAAPGDSSFPATIVPIVVDSDSQDGATLGTPAAPVVVDGAGGIDVSDDSGVVVPDVKCVGKEAIPETNAVKAVVVTADCEATKGIIQENPSAWRQNYTIDIFQEGNNLLMASNDAKLGTLADALKSEHLKDKLGVTKVEVPTSSGSSVFVGILVTGLLAALAITVGYLKCQRKPEAKGARLAEEAYPADQENQGNTLASEAPLNPPAETPEKPSVNGESPEAAKTQPPPPTNGHSTAKTADTEL